MGGGQVHKRRSAELCWCEILSGTSALSDIAVTVEKHKDQTNHISNRVRHLDINGRWHSHCTITILSTEPWMGKPRSDKEHTGMSEHNDLAAGTRQKASGSCDAASSGILGNVCLSECGSCSEQRCPQKLSVCRSSANGSVHATQQPHSTHAFP